MEQFFQQDFRKSENGGMKDDAGKVRPSLIDPVFLEEMAFILTKGAEKYGDFNWQGLDIARVKDSMFRHLLHYMNGEVQDKDYPYGSNLSAIAVNAMFLSYLERKEKGAKDEH
jgi:hypothetical protein